MTPRPPRFLPDDVDGRALFAVATARRRALDAGLADTGGVAGLGDVVMVPPVREARDRGVLVARPMFERITPAGVVWPDGTFQPADVVLWCTGFRPDLGHLAPSGCADPTATSRRPAPGPYWSRACTCWATATGPGRGRRLIGVGRTAREAVNEIGARLQEHGPAATAAL